VQDVKDLQDRTGSKTATKDVYVTAFLKGPIAPELATYTRLQEALPQRQAAVAVVLRHVGALTIVEALKRVGPTSPATSSSPH